MGAPKQGIKAGPVYAGWRESPSGGISPRKIGLPEMPHQSPASVSPTSENPAWKSGQIDNKQHCFSEKPKGLLLSAHLDGAMR
jgi:hypothetical protein